MAPSDNPFDAPATDTAAWQPVQSDVFALTQALWKRVGRSVVLLVVGITLINLIIALPGMGLQLGAALAQANGDFGLGTTLSFAQTGWSLVSIVPSLLVGAVIAALARPLRAIALGEEVEGGAMGLLRATFPKLLNVIGATLLVGVVTLVGALFCVLPGLAAGFLLSATAYLVAAGDRPVIDAMKESFELVRDNVGFVLVNVLILIGLTIAVTVVVGIVGGVLGGGAALAAAAIDDDLLPVGAAAAGIVGVLLGQLVSIPVQTFTILFFNSVWMTLDFGQNGLTPALDTEPAV